MVIINHRITIAAGTPNSSIAVEETAPINLGDEFEMESFQIWMGFRAKTVGEGPVYIGIHDQDYPVTEVADYYTAGGPTNRSAKTEEERSKRNIMPFGICNPNQAHGLVTFARSQKGHIFQKWRSIYSDTSGPAFHIFNDDDAALTGALIVQGFSRLKGKWI